MNASAKNRRIVFPSAGVCALEESEIPVPGPNQALISTELSLISTGTELTLLNASAASDSSWQDILTYPQYPGYSNVGTVTAVGPGVAPSLVGARVLSLGPHARYVCRSVYEMIVIPPTVASEEAVFGIIAQIAMGGVRFASLRFGDVVVVFGAGLIGQFAARFARMAGASLVFVSDRSDFRLSLLPADSSFYPSNATRENVRDLVLAKNRSTLAAVAIDTTGNPDRMESELRVLADMGRLIVLSSPHGKSTIDLDYVNIHALSIVGAHNFTVHTPSAVPGNPYTLRHDSQEFIDMLSRGQISVKGLITHRDSYQNAPALYEMLTKDRQNALGVIMNWSD